MKKTNNQTPSTPSIPSIRTIRDLCTRPRETPIPLHPEAGGHWGELNLREMPIEQINTITDLLTDSCSSKQYLRTGVWTKEDAQWQTAAIRDRKEYEVDYNLLHWTLWQTPSKVLWMVRQMSQRDDPETMRSLAKANLDRIIHSVWADGYAWCDYAQQIKIQTYLYDSGLERIMITHTLPTKNNKDLDFFMDTDGSVTPTSEYPEYLL